MEKMNIEKRKVDTWIPGRCRSDQFSSVNEP